MTCYRATYMTAAGAISVCFDHEPEDREIQGQDCYADATSVGVTAITREEYDARFARIRVFAYRRLVEA